VQNDVMGGVGDQRGDHRPVALFDLDDTLIDRDAAYRRWAEWFAAGRSLGDGAVEFLCEADGHGYVPRPDVFAAVRARFDLADDVSALVAAYRDTYLGFFEPEPEVQVALQRLRDLGWRIGVVTNGPAAQLDKLARAGLDALVDAVCASGIVGVEKPDRAIFEEAVRQVSGGDPAGGVWMIGDSVLNDIGGGRRMGFRTVWVQRGRVWDHPEFEPDHEVADVPAAVEVLVAG
jgi:HAD superfamily hydrolase (TIGR01549 family)